MTRTFNSAKYSHSINFVPLPIKAVFLLIFTLSVKCPAQGDFIPGKPALAYWLIGDKAETVIMIHGGPAAGHNYLRPEFDALKKVAKVIYYDQRGCGASDTAESYTLTDHVNDLKRLITTLSDNKKVIMIGSSWGSLLAIAYAYYHPEDVKGMILTGTVQWLGIQATFQEYLDFRNKRFEKWPVTKIQPYSFSEKRIVNVKGQRGKMKVDTIDVWKQILISTGRPQFEPMRSFMTAPNVDSLKRINIPVLVFNGSRKPKHTDWDWGRNYAGIFPNAKLYTINYGYHDPWMTDPETFFKVSKKFISEIKRKK